jgi:hypothetical protein
VGKEIIKYTILPPGKAQGAWEEYPRIEKKKRSGLSTDPYLYEIESHYRRNRRKKRDDESEEAETRS